MLESLKKEKIMQKFKFQPLFKSKVETTIEEVIEMKNEKCSKKRDEKLNSNKKKWIFLLGRECNVFC